MHSHRKSIITLISYFTFQENEFWIDKMVWNFLRIKHVVFFYDHKRCIRTIFFLENAYLIFVTGFGSPLMLVLVTMVTMMVHYLRFENDVNDLLVSRHLLQLLQLKIRLKVWWTTMVVVCLPLPFSHGGGLSQKWSSAQRGTAKEMLQKASLLHGRCWCESQSWVMHYVSSCIVWFLGGLLNFGRGEVC